MIGDTMDKEQYEATSRDPVAFHKDGDVSRKTPFSFLPSVGFYVFESTHVMRSLVYGEPLSSFCIF